MLSTPKAEIDITEELVYELIKNQVHELEHFPLTYLASGWDNVMYRLGEDYIVRLPRRLLGAKLIRNEQLYLDHLPHNLPIDIPRTIYCGQPEGDYPWHWSVLPFYAGVAADTTTLHSSEIGRFIEFLLCIHQPADDNAPINIHRGVPLTERAADMDTRLLSVKEYLPESYPPLLKLWEKALSAENHLTDNWIHGDLHPRNILVDEGKLSAIIDWGDITSGDVATDLAAIWMLFDDAHARSAGIKLYAMDTDLLVRAVGWAIYFGTVFYQSGLSDNPRHVKIGEKIFSRIFEDFG